jgi:hypothetical protein
VDWISDKSGEASRRRDSRKRFTRLINKDFRRNLYMPLARKTTEEKRARSTETHREWRKNNPEAQKAIMERYWQKKVAGMQQAYNADLGNIQAELKEVKS